LAEIAWGDSPNGEAAEELWLRAVVADTTGAPSIRLSATGSPSEATAVGERLAAEMLAEGAASLMGVPS
jgi:hydroxymethylbilane synthase